jgi:mannose-6-phosphate isomerase-like protein (cupin superfamily)
MKRRHFLGTTFAASLTAPTLTASDKPDTSKPFIVKAGKARAEPLNPGGVLKVSGKDTGGQFCLFETANEAGPMAGPPLHVHPNQDEVFMIVEGEFIFQVGTERIAASAGDVVFGPRNVPHTFYQKSKKARMIFSYNPAGKMETIMNEMTKLMPANPQAFAKVCAENDVPFVGPPMTGE